MHQTVRFGLVFLFQLCNSNNHVSFKLFSSTDGMRLVNADVTTYNIQHVTECSYRCTSDVTCLSFNVLMGNNGQMQCELNKNSRSSSLVSDAASTYYGKFVS